MAGTQPKGLCIVTRCNSTDDLVARLHPFCDDSSIFVTTTRVWDVGTVSRFAITLADRSVVLHGRCTVTGAWPDGDNAFGRPGVKLELLELLGKSREVFARMQANRKPSEPSPKLQPMMLPMPNEISDAFVRAMSQLPTQLDDGPTDRTEQPPKARPTMIVGRASVVSQAMQLDTTARSSMPPMPPRFVRPPSAKPPPPPRPTRAPYGTPLHGSSPLGPPLRSARGTNSIVGLGPCPGADDLDPDTLVKPAPVTILGVDTAKLEKKAPPLAVELPPPVSQPRAPVTSEPVVTAGVSARAPMRQIAFASLPPPIREARTPGSPFVLPANPLMGLSNAAIEGFVDCTLYEDLASDDAIVAEPVAVSPSMITRVITELDADPTAHDDRSLAPVHKAQLPTIESFAARLPWRSIGRIIGVVAVVLMAAFLILFESGRW